MSTHTILAGIILGTVIALGTWLLIPTILRTLFTALALLRAAWVYARSRRRGEDASRVLALRRLPGGGRRSIAEFREQEAAGWPEWARARSLDDAGALMVEWLDARTLVHPGHLAPPDPETDEIADDLRALNRMGGVVTTTSQTGWRGLSGRQRAYVMGIATPAAAAELKQRALSAGMIWTDEGRSDTDRGNSGRKVALTSGWFLPAWFVRYRIPEHSAEFVPWMTGVPDGERETWRCFAAADPKWGRKRTLWDAFLDVHAGQIGCQITETDLFRLAASSPPRPGR